MIGTVGCMQPECFLHDGLEVPKVADVGLGDDDGGVDAKLVGAVDPWFASTRTYRRHGLYCDSNLSHGSGGGDALLAE